MEDVGWRPRKLDSKCYLVCGLWWLFGCLKVAKWFLLGKFWNKLESVIQVSGCAQYHCHHVSVYKYAKDTQPSELSAQSSPNHGAVGVHWILQPEVGEASWHQFFLCHCQK